MRAVVIGRYLFGRAAMVGAAGFEPATLCSQSRCATRLRYAPDHLPPLNSLGICRRARKSGSSDQGAERHRIPRNGVVSPRKGKVPGPVEAVDRAPAADRQRHRLPYWTPFMREAEDAAVLASFNGRREPPG